MTDPPAFLSFPDFSEDASEGRKNGESSRGSAPPAISFSSFPDIDLEPKREDKEERKRKAARDESRVERHKERRREKDDGERRRHRRDRDENDDRNKERDRHHSESERRKERRELVRSHKERRREDERSSRRSSRERDTGHDRHGRHRERHDDDDGKRNSRDDRKRRREDKGDDAEADEARREKEARRAKERVRAQALRDAEPGDGVPWYESTKKVVAADTPGQASHSDWFVDVVGDQDVLRYGTPSTRNPLRYYRDFGGRVLGLPLHVRIIRSREHGLEIAPFGRPYIPRYSARAIDGGVHRARLLLRPKESAGDFDDDFLPLDSAARKRARQDEDELPDYRAISKTDADDEDEFQTLQAILGDLATLDDDLKARRTEHERHLREHPDDVQRWIKYSTLHIQESPNAQTAGAFVDPAKAPVSRANAEVTLSVLERAFDAHRANHNSPELHIAFLHAAEALWPAAKVTQRWKNVIRELGRTIPEEDMMAVYLAYIDWREGDGFGKTEKGSVAADEVVDVYIECIARLSAIDRDQEAREENQVYLALRACLFLKLAGYAERALAIFQGLMEVTFFKPAYLRPPAPPFDHRMWFEGVVSEFESFWESEAPRIGENGAKGWKATHESADAVDIPRWSGSAPAQEGVDKYASWLAAEQHATSSFQLPGRVRDHGAPDDDPFYVILFEDIEPFLFPVQTPSARQQLVYAFFTFLGLPFAPPDAPTSSPSVADPHLRWALSQNQTWQTVGGAPMDAEQPRILKSPFACPVKSWMSDRSTLFAGPGWFRDMTEAELGHVDVGFARNVLSLMQPQIPDPSFVLSTFAFEAAISPKAAVKVAKRILSTDSDNLVLWDGYARLERQGGKLDAARQVYATAIQAAEQRATADAAAKEDLEHDMGELWAAWAELEYEAGNEELCLLVLVMAAGMRRELIAECTQPGFKPPSLPPISMLKARQLYQSSFSQSSHQLVLGTLFFCLTDGIEEARSRLLGVVDTLPKGHPHAEEALQLLLKTLHIYTSRHSAPASLMRDVVQRAIDMFPNNTIFLSLFLWGEASRRVYGNVQRLTASLTAEDRGVVPLLWAVWAEAQAASRTFWDAGGSGAERVRRALDRGVNSTKGRRSAALWILYIEFEALMGRPAAAKALCYRAIAAVGGCKDLYLLPFSTLRQHFTSSELRDVADLMLERGIRVRVPTYAYWDTADSDAESDSDDDTDPEDAPRAIEGDYEYGMLREREVLKPY